MFYPEDSPAFGFFPFGRPDFQVLLTYLALLHVPRRLTVPSTESAILVEPPLRPLLDRLLRRDDEQDALLAAQALADGVVVGGLDAVLLGDAAEVGQAALMVLPDLNRAVEEDALEAGRVV